MTGGASNLPPVLRATAGAARVLALVAGAAVVVLALLICIDIGARSVLRVSVQGSDEIGGYVLALVGSLGLAHTLLQKAHPRIDLGVRLLPLRLRAPLHVLAMATMAAMGAFMAWHAWGELGQSLTFGAVTNTPLQTPLWVPQGLWLLGTAFFALTAALAAVHGAALLRRDPARIEALYAPTSVEEEVGAFLGDAAPKFPEGDR